MVEGTSAITPSSVCDSTNITSTGAVYVGAGVLAPTYTVPVEVILVESQTEEGVTLTLGFCYLNSKVYLNYKRKMSSYYQLISITID
jgi:hypothetical protein